MTALPADTAMRSNVRRGLALLLFAACAAGPALSQDAPGKAAQEIGELAKEGRAELKRGHGDRAIEIFQAAREIAQRTGDFESFVILGEQIAVAHGVAGRLEEKLVTFRSIQSFVDENADVNPAFTASVAVQSRAQAATVLRQLGRYHEALVEAHAAADRLERTTDPLARASGWSALGSSLMSVGRIVEAGAEFRRAVSAVADLPSDSARRIEIELNLAECLGELGARSEALSLTSAVIDRLEAAKDVDPFLLPCAHTMRGRLQCYVDWPAAEADLRRAREEFEPVYGPAAVQQRMLADLYLATAVRNLGRPAESVEIERGVFERASAALGAGHPITIHASLSVANSLWDLADATADRKLLSEARARYEEASALGHRNGLPYAYMADASLGQLVLDRFDDPTAAEPWLRRAVDAIEDASAAALSADAEVRAALFRRQRSDNREDPYEDLLRCELRLARPEEALRVLELSRARGLRDLIDASRFDPVEEALHRAEESGDERAAASLRALPGKIDAALGELAAARAALAATTPATGEAKEDPRLTAALAGLRALYGERAELTRGVSDLAAPADVARIRHALREGDALIAYFLGRTESFVCLADGAKGSLDWFPLRDDHDRPLTAKRIAADVDELLRALDRVGVNPDRGVSPAGASVADPREAQLAASLFKSTVPAPLWERLRGKSLVYVLPHGSLHRLPFEVLVTAAGSGTTEGRRWLDDGPPIAYEESGSALVWSLARRATQQRDRAAIEALVIGDPDYSAGRVRSEDLVGDTVVARVRNGGRAARAGVRAGDVVKGYAGAPVEDASALERAWRAAADRAACEIAVVRGREERRLPIEPGDPGVDVSPATRLRGSTEPSAAGPTLPRLPGSAREAQAVAEALRLSGPRARDANVVHVFTGADATETILAAWAPRSTIIHVAAHQIEDPFGRFQSGRLALTPPPLPTVEDDGFVDLDELLLRWRKRLDRCELLVLSSCRSRTGRPEDDEGFYSLPLGFRFAGCPTVIASLWAVDDEATATMMASFYRTLGTEKDADRIVAFTAARRELKRVRPDPRAWAPFVWMGAPR